MASKGQGGSHPRRTTDFPAGSSGHSEELREGLKESVQETASQLGESAGQMKEKAREFVSGMAGQAQEAWRGARDQLQERFSDFSGRAGDIFEDGVAFVRRYPLASLAVAFGIGCLTSCAFFAMSRSTEDVPERMSRASS
jgi:ElaB/YqjD/DUF883 family membrane-anchored ribosome-binding protein